MKFNKNFHKIYNRRNRVIETINPELIIHKTQFRELLDLNKTQWLSTEELEDIQNYFLRKLVVEAYENVPFYRKLLGKYDTNPYEVKSITDLSNLPIITKDTFFEYGNEMNHRNIANLKGEYTGTGGSTGKTLKYYKTPEVIYYGIGCRDRGFGWAGFNLKRDKVAFLAGGSLGVTDQVIIKNNIIKVPATGITSASVVDKYYDALKEFKPDYMRAYASALYAFCEYLRKNNKKLTLKSVVTTSEVLTDFHRSYIEETLNCKIFDEYGAYDGGAGAFECDQHRGLHMQMERGIIELLDENNNPVKPGQLGRVICTDIHNYMTPFIRYDVGDMAVLSKEKCSCGRGLKLFDRIEGRRSDYIMLKDGTKVSGISVYIEFCYLYQNGSIDIRQYQIIQKKDLSVHVNMVVGKEFENHHLDLIRAAYRDYLPGLEIVLNILDEIPLTKGQKRRFVISEIEENKIPIKLDTVKESKVNNDNRKLNILFLQNSPCIRNYKYAKAIRDRGHDVTLLYTVKSLAENYPNLSNSVYTDIKQIQSYRDLWDISENYDLIHSHNEPDILTVAALASDIPVIHDTHDLISLRDAHDPNTSYFEGIANRGAHGRIYSTSYQQREAEKMYGVKGESLIFPNYISDSDKPKEFLPKLSAKDGRTHIVYEGGIGGSAHRKFENIFIDIANKGIIVHLYPSRYNDKHDNIFGSHPNIRYNKPVSPKEIMTIMTQFDFGIIPWNITSQNKRFLDSTIANKLFEYLASGLPVFASPIQSYVDYFADNEVGCLFNNVDDIMTNLDKMKQLAQKANLKENILSYENRIDEVINFYKKIIKNYRKQ